MAGAAVARFNIFLGLGVAAVGEGAVAGGVAAECYDYATFDDRTGPGPMPDNFD